MTVVTHVDGVDGLERLLGLDSTRSSDIDVSLGNEYIAIRHGHCCQDVLSSSQHDRFVVVQGAWVTYLFQWISRVRDDTLWLWFLSRISEARSREQCAYDQR